MLVHIADVSHRRRITARPRRAGEGQRTSNPGMIRPVLIEIALFLAPFAAYALFVWATRSGVLHPDAWNMRVIGWLTFVALALMVGSFIVMAQFGGAPPHSEYVPAHIENGKLVPGTTR